MIGRALRRPEARHLRALDGVRYIARTAAAIVDHAGGTVG